MFDLKDWLIGIDRNILDWLSFINTQHSFDSWISIDLWFFNVFFSSCVNVSIWCSLIGNVLEIEMWKQVSVSCLILISLPISLTCSINSFISFLLLVGTYSIIIITKKIN